ncbi:MAG TPA: HEAT repeat domain-containing protein [Anaerolineales bacterium]|nr:HEAT repeat domain-containing protein [Anaerolineales bacterium]
MTTLKSPKRPADIPFQQVLDAYLDSETPFPPRFLNRLSDLSHADLEALNKVWQEAPSWRRQAIMEDIESLGEADTLLSFEALAQHALQDDEASVRVPAVRVLSEFENPAHASRFMALLESDPDTEVRAAAASALGYYVYLGELDELDPLKKAEIETCLLKYFHGNHADLIRRRALEALGYSSLEEVQPLIQQAYASENRDWKASALYAMGRSASEIWLPQVLESLESILPQIRAEAARAAGEIDAHVAVERLIELLDDPDEDVMTAAIWSLSQLGGEGVGDALAKVFKRTDDDELAEWIDSAMENLAFTEGVQAFEMLDLAEDELDDDDDEDDEELEDDELENVDEYLESLDDEDRDLFDLEAEDEEF